MERWRQYLYVSFNIKDKVKIREDDERWESLWNNKSPGQEMSVQNLSSNETKNYGKKFLHWYK